MRKQRKKIKKFGNTQESQRQQERGEHEKQRRFRKVLEHPEKLRQQKASLPGATETT